MAMADLTLQTLHRSAAAAFLCYPSPPQLRGHVPPQETAAGFGRGVVCARPYGSTHSMPAVKVPHARARDFITRQTPGNFRVLGPFAPPSANPGRTRGRHWAGAHPGIILVQCLEPFAITAWARIKNGPLSGKLTIRLPQIPLDLAGSFRLHSAEAPQLHSRATRNSTDPSFKACSKSEEMASPNCLLCSWVRASSALRQANRILTRCSLAPGRGCFFFCSSPTAPMKLRATPLGC